ncbi:MAG: hypothetical protein WKF84_20275 [Pyrinomonadaceae bacterium]
MQRILSISLLVVLTFFVSSSLRAQTTQQKPSTPTATNISGTWAGTYEGDDAGKLELTFSSSSDGKETGKMNINTDQGESYSVDLKTVSVSDNKLIATYTSPQGSDEIMMEGVIDNNTVTGKWALGPTGSPSSTGTWKASKK